MNEGVIRRLNEIPYFKGFLPFIDGKLILRTKGADSTDIMRDLENDVPEAIRDTRALATKFNSSNKIAVGAKVHEFLRTWLVYDKDAPLSQIAKLPRVSMRMRKCDCKSYSLLAAGLLVNCGIPVRLVYAGYVSGRNKPSHVYVMSAYTYNSYGDRDVNGKHIIVDGCYPYFNKEKTYTFVKRSQIFK